MGSLHYIWGSMNSSKSAQLLMVAHNYEESGKKVLVVKPNLDTRDGEYIQSRALDVRRKVDILLDKDRVCQVINKLLEEGIRPSYDVVLVDEAQFLTKAQVDELADIVDLLDIPVMAYGLRADFNCNLFEGSKRLFEVADKFQEFKTICPCCGSKAIVNMRVNEKGEPVFDGEQVQAGNNYMPVCRRYYKKLKKQFS